MPVSKVQGGYRWGQSGKVYPTEAQAQRQGRAAYASGYKGYQEGGVAENNNSNLRFERNKGFFENFHQNVLETGRQGTTERGETITMRIIGVNVGGKEYLLPSWNPDTGKVMSGAESVNRFLPLIESGQIEGYDSPEQAEIDRKIFYPEIIRGREPIEKYNGGITEVTQGDDPSMADRVGNFMDAAGNEENYSFWDRILDMPLGPGSRTTLRDAPEYFKGALPVIAETARYMPLVSGDIAEAGHFLSSLRSPEYREGLLTAPPMTTPYGALEEAREELGPETYSLLSQHGQLPSVSQFNQPQWEGIAAFLPAIPFMSTLQKAGIRRTREARAAETARDTSQGGRGITSLEETRKIDVDTFARDESGFVSPTIQALIEKAPPKLKGQEIIEWARANAKPKELEFLGLDEFVSANPNATVREAVEGISGNKVTVSRNIRSGGEEVLEFERMDGSSLWQHRVDDLKYNLEQGDEFTKDELLSVYNYPFPKTAWLQSFDDIPESAIDDLLEVLAKQEYSDNPYELLKPVSGTGGYGSVGPASGRTFAFGNDDIGYSLFVDGERVTDADNIPYSRTEAEIQLQANLGLEDYFGEGTQFKQYVDDSLPGGENYREVSFNWDNAPSTHHLSHEGFDDETQIAHALIRDRKLADGTPSLHIDELQSPLHIAGSREGYQLSKAGELGAINKIEKILEGTPVRYAERGSEKGILVPDAGGASYSVPEPRFISFDTLPSARERSPAYALEWGELSRESNLKFDIIAEHLGSSSDKLLEAAEPFVRESSKAPNYPFKDNYHEMVLKNLLLQAIEEGRPALSISGSAPIKARYSEEYSKFYELLYDRRVPSAMKRLANRYGGKFEQGRLDIFDTYPLMRERNPNLEHLDDMSELDSNIIRITPEMRERILEEGIPSFGAGGIVNVTQGDDPSTVDRVRNFMGGINAGRNRP